MEFIILLLIIIFLILLIFREKSLFTQSNKYYETLKKEWSSIFLMGEMQQVLNF